MEDHSHKLFHELLDQDVFELRKAGITGVRIANEVGDDTGSRLSAMSHDGVAKASFDKTCSYLHALARRGKASVIEGILHDTPLTIVPRYDLGTHAEDSGNILCAFADLTYSAADLQGAIAEAMQDGQITHQELLRILSKTKRLHAVAAGVEESARKEAVEGQKGQTKNAA